MIGRLCEECDSRSRCLEFGISPELISRIMIGKSAHTNEGPFPIALYRKELEEENLDPESTLTFIETIMPHCIYLR